MKDLSSYSARPYRFIGRYVAKYPVSHATILAAVVIAVFCSVSTHYGVKFLIDALSDTDGHNRVWIGFGLLVLLIAADNSLWRVASCIANFAFVHVTGSVRRDLFGHLMGHPPGFFHTQPPGALTSRISSTSNAIYTGEMMLTFNVLPPLIAMVVSIAYVATVSSAMASGIAIAGAAIGGFIFLHASRARPLHHAYANEAAAVDGQMVDVVSNATLVRAFGRLGFERRRLKSVVDEEMSARKRSLYSLERLRILHAVATSMFTFAMLAWVIALWSNGEATAGDVILVCTLGMSILSATRDLAVALVDVTQHLARLSEALETLLVPHRARHSSRVPVAPARNAIEFRDVTFLYPDGRPVLHSLNLKVGHGEKVGIVGPSGSGKSTMFSLIQRFYEAEQGTVLVDGVNVCELAEIPLRRTIGVVSQDVLLLHRSLRENISYGRPKATDKEIRDAAEAALCDDFIAAMPHGLDTVVGDRGAKLSGGQRQRIAIARAFLKDAPILLLDEATSALDARSEEMVREALQRLMIGRTVLVIAHHLSTLRHVQRVVVVEGGAVVEDGSPTDLIRGGGRYKSLVDFELAQLQSVSHAA